MSTSVTNPIKKRWKRSLITYAGLSIFLLIFGLVYQAFSYGETSLFMQGAYLIPLVGGGLYLLILKIYPLASRLSMNLWNSALATWTVGALLRGIINLSGRSTSFDLVYWLVGGGFLLLAILSLIFTQSQWQEE